MSKKIKKFIFPGIALIASFYASVLFAVGGIIGYIATTLFHKRIKKKKGRVKGIDLPFLKWNIHFHHWIMGGLAILFTYLFSSLSIFWIGIFGGLIFHDIHTDKKWYKIIQRK